MHIPVKRSKDNQILGGVVAGLCEHFDWNPAIGRVLYVVLSFTPIFPGILVYLVLWLLMEKPDQV
ncbi:PspC domain-containing protein [Companilactobacillus suantsaicola]|uniref:PspC domain-containing protein n=1 Tax=Companilactobacillus suantsaicola TaxID=2487723 RepID=A0A4Z0JLC7_9LACO|nr:PspC domain-containing protein [Companilactobacillus suantsaicola]TGD22914.1 PspC domain-containing protein [Companilactobacillus suantsaicola]